MLNNKHGLSAIIVTLILILLAIVAVGVVWVVVNNILKSETGRVNVGASCLDISVEATQATCVDDNPLAEPKSICDVTVTRSASGDEIGGIKLVFTNETGDSSWLETVPGNIEPLATFTKSAVDTNIANVNKVEVVVYLDDSGTAQNCPNSNPFEF